MAENVVTLERRPDGWRVTSGDSVRDFPPLEFAAALRLYQSILIRRRLGS